jgi:hypothetical protein
MSLLKKEIGFQIQFAPTDRHGSVGKIDLSSIGTGPLIAIIVFFNYSKIKCTPLFQGRDALPPANPAISEPVFPTLFNSMAVIAH